MPRLLAALAAALEHSVRTQHPLFLNQLYARPEPAGIAGALHRCASIVGVFCVPLRTLKPSEGWGGPTTCQRRAGAPSTHAATPESKADAQGYTGTLFV